MQAKDANPEELTDAACGAANSEAIREASLLAVADQQASRLPVRDDFFTPEDLGTNAARAAPSGSASQGLDQCCQGRSRSGCKDGNGELSGSDLTLPEGLDERRDLHLVQRIGSSSRDDGTQCGSEEDSMDIDGERDRGSSSSSSSSSSDEGEEGGYGAGGLSWEAVMAQIIAQVRLSCCTLAKHVQRTVQLLQLLQLW
jgi:hypothetical protein